MRLFSTITKYAAVVVATATIVFAYTSQAQQVTTPVSKATAMPESFADIVDTLSPAVVNISTKQTIVTRGDLAGNPFGGLRGQPGMEQFQQFFEQFDQLNRPREKEVSSLGSGFVVSDDGYIITNSHVIAGADQITVRFHDDSELEAKVVGNDTKTDLALLKVKPKKTLAYVPLGDSDKARVGDWVIAIGNPFGLGGTVTTGIISARQRSINAGPYDDFIQTDAAINRGNSGGPLFNMHGEVIGINSAIFSPTGGNVGIGFAIPTSLAKPIIEQLKKHGKAHRGWLGVKIQDVTDEVANSVGLPKKMGALVVDLTKGGPADKAGVQPGDIVTHFNGTEIKEMRLLPRMVAESAIGKPATMTIWRGGASKKLTLDIAELADDSVAANDNDTEKSLEKKDAQEVAGLKLSTLTDAHRQQLRLPKTVQGIVVIGVNPDSAAASRGVKPGDVITEVNNSPVPDAPRFKRLLEDAKKAGRNFALLRIIRGDQSAFITLPLK